LDVLEKVEIVKDILFYHPDSGKIYIDSIFTISERIDCKFGCIQANNLMGNYYWITNNLDSALIYFLQGLEIKNIDNYPERKVALLSNLGLIYAHQLKSDSARKYLLQTVDFASSNGFNGISDKALFDLGNLYLAKDDYINALKYLSEAEMGMEKSDDSLRLLFVYSSFGLLYSKVGNFELALESFMKSIAYDSKLPQIDNRSNTYNNIGELYFWNADNYDSALRYYRKALGASLPHNRQYFEVSSYSNIGNVFMEWQQYDSAKYYYDKVLNNPMTGRESVSRAAILVNMGLYYNRVGDYTSSESFLKKGLKMTKSLGLMNYSRNALYGLAQLKAVSYTI
jgi:tetratricopeptide (TPR) repeat protein